MLCGIFKKIPDKGKKDKWSKYQKKTIENVKIIGEFCFSVPGKVLNRLILEKLRTTVDSKRMQH